MDKRNSKESASEILEYYLEDFQAPLEVRTSVHTLLDYTDVKDVEDIIALLEEDARNNEFCEFVEASELEYQAYERPTATV